MSQSKEIRVCIDVGSVNHYVAIGLSTGERIEEFHLSHNQEGIDQFFYRLEKLQNKYQLPISVAMESYNGYARPIDSMVLDKGYKLLNVNNLKLARFKEIFPGPAKSDPIDAWMMFDLFNMGDHLPMAKNILQEVGEIPEVNKKLKFLTRRRDVLVIEKASIANRLQGDLLAIAPGILSITKSISNRWFLNFLTAKEDIRQLSRMQRKTILKVKGVGKNYADSVQKWQKSAIFSPDVSWMIGIKPHVKKMLEGQVLYVGETCAKHPLACAAVAANLNQIQKMGWVENAHKLEKLIRPLLENLKSNHPSVKDCRGIGLFWKIELQSSNEGSPPTPEQMQAVETKLMELGVLADMRLGGIMFAPPLSTTAKEVEYHISTVLDKAFQESDNLL